MHNTITEYKQMHNKTISWNDNWILIFICFEGRLLEPSASSSSSFMIALFLIQMLRLIRSSSRVEIFIFLIAWGIFFSWSSIAPIFSSLLMIQASSSSQSLLKIITSFWNTFLQWMNSTILGDHSRWPSSLPHSPLFLLLLQVVLWFERLLWLHGLCILDLHILQLVSLGHILIFVLPFK